MSKGNLFLGQGRGAVGDVVFTRVDGEQVARARNRHPKNKQTAIQMLQRVIMKTTSVSYSMLRDICDHSFQGKQQGTPNQSEYARVNVSYMREELAQLINDNDPEEILGWQEGNYSGKNDVLPVYRPYILSGGTLNPVSVGVAATGFNIAAFSALDWDITAQGIGPSYQQLVDALGLQRGDQLTFLFGYVDDTEENPYMIDFRYSRLILEPEGGDMTSKVFAQVEGQTNVFVINADAANVRNEGTIYLGASGIVTGNAAAAEYTAGSARTLAAFAVIASRLNGGVWQRSRAQFVIRDNTGTGATSFVHNNAALGDAIYTVLTGASSSLYLNQAQDF